MTRIIAGTAGGRRLSTPPGRGTRPMTDRVREALFARLEHLGAIEGADVIDLYAGSGALGLEALSRGARTALLVEADRRVVKVIEANVARLGLRGATTRCDTVQRVLQSGAPHPMHLALMGAPYPLPPSDIDAVLGLLTGPGWLVPEAVVVVERSTRSPQPDWPDGLVPLGPRTYGETVCWFAEYLP